MIGLYQTATVYNPDADTGEYTVEVRTNLPCRLALVSTVAEAAGGERAELAETRRLLWGPSYTMPATAQVEVDGVRWNVKPGTLAAVHGPAGNLIYQRCEVTAP